MDDKQVVDTVVSALQKAGYRILELKIDELQFGEFDVITTLDWYCFEIRNGSLYQNDFSGREYVALLDDDLHSAVYTRYSATT